MVCTSPVKNLTLTNDLRPIERDIMVAFAATMRAALFGDQVAEKGMAK